MDDYQGEDPWKDPDLDLSGTPSASDRSSRRTPTGPGSSGGRGGPKPAIVRAKRPLTRESLPQIAFTLDETSENGTGEATGRTGEIEGLKDSTTERGIPGPDGAEEACPVDGSARVDSTAVDEVQDLWDLGAMESSQFAQKLRAIAAYWPAGPDPEHDHRDESEYLIAQALRTTIAHASRLLGDARRATAHLPQLLGLLEQGVLPARWFTFVLRRSSDLGGATLAELDESIATWDLRVDEDRFRRRLSALVRWLRDRQEAAAPTPPQRSVEVFPPDDDGIGCLQVHGPAPEILALGRRLDSAARAVQQAQRHAIATGEEIPFDDGTADERGTPLSLSRLRYEILTRSVLDTGGIPVPKERFRLNLTVPALTLLGVENAPGMLDGIHPIPPEMARELAGGENTWYRVLTDPTTGAFLPLAADKYAPSRDMLEYLRLAFPVCALPGCTRPTSWASQVDHIEEYDHAHPENGGRTEIANLHPLCWRHHQMKTAGLFDPVKESIAHPVAMATQEGAKSAPTADQENPPGQGSPPTRTSPGKSPPRESTPDDDPPATGTATRFDPGVTHWTLRGGTPRRVADECDLITPWLAQAFTTRWHEYQERLAAHGVDHTTADTPPGPEPPF